MELVGSLFISTSWLEFFGPGVVDVVDVLPVGVVVKVVDVLAVEDVELVGAGPETDRK
jgi:hypothetical protein